MKSRFERIPGFWVAGFSLIGLFSFSGCLGGDEDSGSDAGGSGGSGGGSSGTGGSAATSAGGGGPVGTACASPIALAGTKPAIADFEEYDGSADLSTWSFALGGDSSSGILAGTFGYGDEPSGFPEAFAMVEGNGSSYGLGISDSLSEEYGGGMGLWISECLNASAFAGLSFWVRGNSPTGDAKVSLMMQETAANMPATADAKIGTCPGTDEQCVHPSYTFAVTDDWTEIQIPWLSFTAGSAAGTAVVPDGRNVWQIQYDIGLVWAPDANDVYAPTPAEYELVIDDLTFY